MAVKICPKCKSKETKMVEYQGGLFLFCNACGYDESQEVDVYPEQKSSQKAKGSFSPYKTGGARRTK